VLRFPTFRAHNLFLASGKKQMGMDTYIARIVRVVLSLPPRNIAQHSSLRKLHVAMKFHSGGVV
jgi:hypothetical protein